MATEVRQIYVRKDGEWQPIAKVKIRKDGAWATMKGVYHGGGWHIVKKTETKHFSVHVGTNVGSSNLTHVGRYTIITEP